MKEPLPTSRPPPLIKDGTEEGEIGGLVKASPGELGPDIMSCLEMKLSVNITDEDWEDLFKGDI